jgi:hypothetical protein
MVPADLVFFITPDLTPQQQLSFLGYYRKIFEGRLNRYWSARLEASEATAREALARVSATSAA